MASSKIIIAIDTEDQIRLLSVLNATSSGTGHFILEDYREGGDWEYPKELAPGVYIADLTIYSYTSSNPECPDSDYAIKISNAVSLLNIDFYVKKYKQDNTAPVHDAMFDDMDAIIDSID
jgi:hypothetical protein